ncbi:hypothetical protein BDV93DRAFT_240695 [Ceratobasidium sp. AG-I]|nr:hypothetical protein BDV93DRAFT_240695 [Ceratobasidium sp. AG-I]
MYLCWWGFCPGLRSLTRSRSLIIHLHLPDTLDLTRWSIYSSYVKKLLINSKILDIHGNLDIISYLTHSTALLPNLSTIVYLSYPLLNQKAVKWTKIFLSPSLKTIQSGSQRSTATLAWTGAWLGLDLASELLDSLSSSCPNLESLDIYPSTLRDHRRLDATLRSNLVFQFSNSIRSFSHLQELSSNTMVLELCIILVLGALPNLKILALYSCESDEVVDNQLLPESAFAALRRLDLKMLDVDIMTKICGMKSLVWQLSTMNILLEADDSAIISLAKPICALAETNSTLCSLVIDSESYLQLTLEPAILQCFRKLPLERLALPLHTFSPETSFKSLFEALPTIEDIYFVEEGPDDTTLEQLLVELPNFRSLETGIEFVPSRCFYGFDSVVPQYQSLSPWKLRMSYEQDINYDIARSVARLKIRPHNVGN